MNVSYVKKNVTIDMIYNRLVVEYSSIFHQRSDQHFTLLMNLIHDYLLYQNEKTKDMIRNLLIKILKNREDELLDITYHPSIINFSSEKKTNEGLKRFIPTFIKIRQLAYHNAYILASKLVEEEIPDTEIYEDFNLLSHLLSKFTFENFYADIAIYKEKENLERFYQECDLLDMIVAIIKKESISGKRFEELESFFGENEQKLFGYLKKRFLIRLPQKRKD